MIEGNLDLGDLSIEKVSRLRNICNTIIFGLRGEELRGLTKASRRKRNRRVAGGEEQEDMEYNISADIKRLWDTIEDDDVLDPAPRDELSLDPAVRKQVRDLIHTIEMHEGDDHTSIVTKARQISLAMNPLIQDKKPWMPEDEKVVVHQQDAMLTWPPTREQAAIVERTRERLAQEEMVKRSTWKELPTDVEELKNDVLEEEARSHGEDVLDEVVQTRIFAADAKENEDNDQSSIYYLVEKGQRGYAEGARRFELARRQENIQVSSQDTDSAADDSSKESRDVDMEDEESSQSVIDDEGRTARDDASVEPGRMNVDSEHRSVDLQYRSVASENRSVASESHLPQMSEDGLDVSHERMRHVGYNSALDFTHDDFDIDIDSEEERRANPMSARRLAQWRRWVDTHGDQLVGENDWQDDY